MTVVQLASFINQNKRQPAPNEVNMSRIAIKRDEAYRLAEVLHNDMRGSDELSLGNWNERLPKPLL